MELHMLGERRTTGAPQNHWFGPCGDPRSAGIGSPEAIIQTGQDIVKL